jgi:hypothetical protein
LCGGDEEEFDERRHRDAPRWSSTGLGIVEVHRRDHPAPDHQHTVFEAVAFAAYTGDAFDLSTTDVTTLNALSRDPLPKQA